MKNKRPKNRSSNVHRYYLSLVVSIYLFSFSNLALAQAWLSNRYAQNCAACHAPGRFNKPLSERRCTLACQGCHVSPNGGGMRSSYGKWTQERWLRTFFVDGLLTHKKTPAKFEEQSYFNSQLALQARKRHSITVAPLDNRPMLITTPDLSIIESKYDRNHEYFDHIEVDERTYKSFIPTGDPYHFEKMFYLSGGADFRYFVLQRINDTPITTQKFRAFPMSADLYLRFRPIPSYLSLVTEARFLNGPSNSQLEKFFTNESRIRSAYVLSDNLPYNSYVMAGLYRPLFGYYTPDHTTLAQTISGLGIRSLFLAASVGASPNVPFINFHLIQPTAGGANIHGFATNLGGRFVTLGASFMFSFWRTNTTTGPTELIKMMYSATGGLQLGPTTLNVDLLHVSQEYTPGFSNGGDVFTLDTQTRFWRENYFLFSGSQSNIARSLLQGKGLEWMFGLKSYLISGLDLELLYINKKDEVSGTESTSNDIQFQIHLFY
ncbi:MAG: cytochrome c [Bdellovibrionales bacterium]|nr:cytochrome c [Bdellovibrionales bacterium]